jgi:DNA invertase Pin-like site-specific DNA recombinase
MHTCDVRRCVNPAHLRLGTQADNIADMDTKGRRRGHVQRGTKNPLAKLTEDDVRKMRAEYAAGARQVDLAARYGIWQGTVSSILRRRTWAHV